MRVLFIGAHCDDIELGCGGTIAKHRDDWEMHCHVLSHHITHDYWKSGVMNFKPESSSDSLQPVASDALKSLGAYSVTFSSFRCCFFYEDRQKIWETMHKLEQDIQPDVVFSHFCDTNQDHCTVHEESRRNFKKRTMYFYWPHSRDNQPYPVNTYSVLDESQVAAKLKSVEFYCDYRGRRRYDHFYFEERYIKASLLYWGSQVVSEYAEGFVLDKTLI